MSRAAGLEHVVGRLDADRPGTYQISGWVRNAGKTADSADSKLTFTYTIN